jgi:transcriptional pleiotropic regulator of transition state genes
MKNTGFVRRIDTLGRIVIPKEVRDIMCVQDDDAMEIYIDNNKIILEKISTVKD